MRMKIVPALVLLAGLVAGPAAAETVILEPSKDNTLYQHPGGFFSSGAGQWMFVGQTFVTRPEGERFRRGLLAFDIASRIPAGATITSVELTVRVNRTRGTQQDVMLHRVTTDWGEGTSTPAPGGGGGVGGTPTPGDATWLHTFHPDQFWTTPGGEFDATVSSTVSMSANGVYTFPSTPQLVADVQGWLDNPETDFGWIMIGDEETLRTTKRIATREDPNPANRPKLVVNFTSSPEIACRFSRVDLGNQPGPTEVLTLNGSIGNGLREVMVPRDTQITVDMIPAKGGPNPGPFVLYLWRNEPTAGTVTPLPRNLGNLCFPILITGGAPQPFKIWNNIGRFNKLGTPDFPSQPAPSNVVTAPAGSSTAVTATLQAILLDDNSAANGPASITNAIILKVP